DGAGAPFALVPRRACRPLYEDAQDGYLPGIVRTVRSVSPLSTRDTQRQRNTLVPRRACRPLYEDAQDGYLPGIVRTVRSVSPLSTRDTQRQRNTSILPLRTRSAQRVRRVSRTLRVSALTLDGCHEHENGGAVGRVQKEKSPCHVTQTPIPCLWCPTVRV